MPGLLHLRRHETELQPDYWCEWTTQLYINNNYDNNNKKNQKVAVTILMLYLFRVIQEVWGTHIHVWELL